MKFFKIFTILILNSIFIFGQQTKLHWPNQIKFSTLREIDFVNPGLEISIEKSHSKNISSQISFALMSDFFKITPFKNYNGFRFSFEKKFYKHSNKQNRNYYSFELAYLNVKYFDKGQFIKDTSLNTPEYLDTFKISKQIFFFNFKYGIQYYFNRFVIDGSVGLGLKYKIVMRSEINDKNAYEVAPRHPNVYFNASSDGNALRPNLVMNLMIGYRF